MARHEAQVVIFSDDRDAGKIFHIQELPAMAAEEWFIRAMKLLARSGVEVPADILSFGAGAFAAIGIGACLTGLSKVPWDEVKPLLSEMMNCVVGYQHEQGAPVVSMLSQILSQVEEPRTLMYIRERIIDLHLGFSMRAKILEYREEVKAMLARENGQNTETYLDPSLSSSGSDSQLLKN